MLVTQLEAHDDLDFCMRTREVCSGCMQRKHVPGEGHVLGEIRIKRMCTSVHSGSAYGASAADGMLMGFGLQSYLLALDAMLDLLQKRNG